MRPHAFLWVNVAIGVNLATLPGLPQSTAEPTLSATPPGDGSVGAADGSGRAARFGWPYGITTGVEGNGTITDAFNGHRHQAAPEKGLTGTGTYSVRNTGSLNVRRERHTATLLPGGKVLVAGGYNETGFLSGAELFDPVTEKWSTTDPMRSPRIGHAATLLADGKVLVTGGFNESGVLASTELYDPVLGSWTMTAPLIASRTFHTVTPLLNGQLLAAGGVDEVDNLSSAELYDPANGKWRDAEPLKHARSRHTATRLQNGQVLVVAGDGDDDESAELYDPSAGSWSPTGSLNDRRSRHTASLLPNGMVLVAGGEYHAEVAHVARATAELYDPTSGTWTRTGRMISLAPAGPPIGRSGHSATLLPNGTVLAAGGTYFYGVLTHSTTEEYEPDKGQWSAAGEMSVPREYHSATLLPDGRVLIAGGFDRVTDATYASAEFYEIADPSGPHLPIHVTDLRILPEGSFRISFTNSPGSLPVIRATTNLSSPGEWSLVGEATEVAPGHFDFIDTQATNHPRRLYQIRIP